MRVLRQNFAGKIGALRQLILELGLHCRIGRELAAVVEVVVVGEQVRFQNVQPVELGEKISGRVRHVAHGIFRVCLLIGAEGGVGAPEVEVVHLLITPIEVSRRRHGVSGVGCETRADQREQGNAAFDRVRICGSEIKTLPSSILCWIRQPARRCQIVVNIDLTLWRTARENRSPTLSPEEGEKGVGSPALPSASGQRSVPASRSSVTAV